MCGYTLLSVCGDLFLISGEKKTNESRLLAGCFVFCVLCFLVFGFFVSAECFFLSLFVSCVRA